MIRSILVPLDGSAFGEHALPLAASLARKAGATVHLAHVHQTVPPATLAGVALLDTIDLHLRQDEQSYLADAARRLGEAAPLPLETALLEGDTVSTLCDYAERARCDLVVMSTHGRGALGRFWLGSITDGVLGRMPRPVLLVRPPEGKCELGRLPELKSVLLPLDGTALAEQVIEPATELGGLFGAAFTLLRVNRPVIRPSYLPEGSTVFGITHGTLGHVEELQARARGESLRYLEGVAARLSGRGVTARARVVVDEDPAVAILTEAEGRPFDLVAMETHARRGLSRLLAGSVADKVVRGAHVPVLLNRPSG